MKSERSVPDEETVVTEKMGIRIVSLLLLVAAISVVVLWTVNPLGSGSETVFAVYLGVDLIAFALISYVQRSVSNGGRIGRIPVVAGCLFMLLLVAVGFYL